MKRILTLFLFIITMQSACFATTNVSFVYLNGSNNNNTKMRNWFLSGIKKLHPTLRDKISKDKYTYKYFLNDGNYVIDKAPTIFFWGDKSQNDLMFMKEKANLLRSISPIIAFFVRNTIADCLHDAIWVQKEHNMIPILQDLDIIVKNQISQNKKVVLLGYSAGSFITMEYLFNKMPYLNLESYLQEKGIDAELLNFVKKYPRKDACLMSIVASDVLNVSPLGTTYINKNKYEFKKGYLNINKYTDKYCIPDDEVIGVINYASPIPLFYSDMADKNLESSRLNHLLYKYLIEHDFFFLTVNYADDPLGFPNGANYTNEEIKDMIHLDFENEEGFFYDYSRTLSWRTFAGAHTSYWKTRKRFSKAIVKGYTEGHQFQYDKEFQQKVLKSRTRKFRT
ncbi:MAG: hypothetical protein ACI4SM_04460 [Candidatus Gastranaerophilaceae bacterium]